LVKSGRRKEDGFLIPAKKKILIIAGEASGDLHGSGVVKALLRLSPDVQVYGVGGENMRQAGAELIIDSSQLAVVGVTEVFGQMGNLIKAYWQLKKFIKTNRLALLILIDFPDFNLLLARVAKGVGVPVLYYISPQVWAWRSGRVQKIASRVNKMAVILPFEVPIFRQAGLDVEFVGHPLLDVLGLNRQEIIFPNTEEWKGDPLIALLPGSRTKEVNALLPSMLRAAEIIREKKPGARFILAVAPSLRVQEGKEFLKSSAVPVTVVQGQTYQVMEAADLVLVASGTATLETAILDKPMVILYHVSSLSYWIGKALVKVKWIGLVNIVAGKRVVPELLQQEARGERIAAEVLKILENESCRQEILQGLAEVRDKLGTPGAAERVARIALEIIGAERKGVES
jgi:lipid-A-disaccharide synthase